MPDAESEPFRSRSERSRAADAAYFTCLLVGLGGLFFGVTGPLLSTFVPILVRNALGDHRTAIGLVMAIDNVLLLLLVPWAGVISDRASSRGGRRLPLVLLGFGLASAGMALFPVSARLGIGRRDRRDRPALLRDQHRALPVPGARRRSRAFALPLARHRRRSRSRCAWGQSCSSCSGRMLGHGDGVLHCRRHGARHRAGLRGRASTNTRRCTSAIRGHVPIVDRRRLVDRRAARSPACGRCSSRRCCCR